MKLEERAERVRRKSFFDEEILEESGKFNVASLWFLFDFILIKVLQRYLNTSWNIGNNKRIIASLYHNEVTLGVLPQLSKYDKN